MKKSMVWIAFLVVSAGLGGQNILDQYIRQGLESNLALKQKRFSWEMSRQLLREARGMFFPSISLESRFSFAGGGRTIDFPLGDLINPIHKTLNQLLEMNGIPSPFPADLENVSFPFYRPFEQETRLRLIQPLFQPAIYYNSRIRSGMQKAEQASMHAYARQLVAEIKTAYFDHLKALAIVELLEETRMLLNENLRVNQLLIDNHVATEEVVLRSRAELGKLKQQRTESEKNVIMSRSYFNFLLNRSLDSPLEIEKNFPTSLPSEIDSESLETQARKTREEYRQLDFSLAAASDNVRLNRSSWLPGISAVMDYGFQGEKFRFGKKDDFWMASVLLNWKLFNGGQDDAKIKQANLEKHQLETKIREVEEQIRLQVQEAVQSVQVARQVLEAAEETVRFSEASFAIIEKKYEQQMVPQIEYIQARNEYTAAKTGLIVARFDLYSREAQLEWSAGTYPLSIKEE